MNKKIKNTGIAAGLTMTMLTVAGFATDRIEIVNSGSEYSYAKSDTGWMSFDIFGKTIFTSLQPFTNEDKMNSEGYPVVGGDKKLYVADTDVPTAALKPVAEALGAMGVVCPADALTISYITESTQDSTPTDASVEESYSNEGAVPLRICIDYGSTAIKENTLVVPLTIEERTGIPLLDLSFKSVTDFCKDVSLQYSQTVNQELHKAKPLNLLLDEAQFDFVLAMNSSVAGPCDSNALRLQQQIAR